jgi:AAA family ATP:ADP antiporter
MDARPIPSRLTHFERFLSIFTAVRPGEGRSVLHLFVTALVVLSVFYLLRPVRDALILGEGGAELRAYLDGAVAISLVFIIPLYKQVYHSLKGSVEKSRILRWVIAFFVSNLLVFFLMARAGLSISIAFYIWLSVFNVMVVAQFWAFATDLFNTKSGQRLFVVIMIGASVGSWLGAASAKYLVGLLSVYQLMLLAGVILTAPIFLSIIAERAVPDGSKNLQTHEDEPDFSGFSNLLGGFDVVFKNHYLRMLAWFMLLLNLVTSLGKYILGDLVKAQAVLAAADPLAAISETQFIAQFYGDYYSWIALIGLVLQLFVVSRLFRYFGVRKTLLVLPIFMLLQFGLLAFLPVFALFRWSMIGQGAVSNSVQNTTSHALYLPLTREQKYVGKTTIETFFVRLGDLGHALVVYVGLNLLGMSTLGFVILNMAFCGMLIVAAVDLRRSHRNTIKDKLSNLPPRIVAPLPDVYATGGRSLIFSIPDECFFDPDPGDTLEFSARLPGGKALPGWVRFDRYDQTFTVKPPAGSKGKLNIELLASDFDGLEVQGTFVLHY